MDLIFTINQKQDSIKFSHAWGTIDIESLMACDNSDDAPATTRIFASMKWTQEAWNSLVASYRAAFHKKHDESWPHDPEPDFVFYDGENMIGDGWHMAPSMSDADVPPDTLFKSILWNDPENPDTIFPVAQVWEDRIWFIVYVGGHDESIWWEEFGNGLTYADLTSNVCAYVDHGHEGFVINKSQV